MSKPKRQHFIPKSYLKNFSVSQGEKYFVEAKLKSDTQPKKQLISIKDICVNKNIYTLPNVEGDGKYSLEKYYAENVDAIYPEVYNLLVDPSITHISKEQREQIVFTTMSLFFRTPKFLNLQEQKTNEILTHLIANYTDKSGYVKVKYKGRLYDFHIDNEEEVRTDLKIENKQNFLTEHLDAWQEFVRFKLDAGLTVYRIYEDFDLITSDNPVFMHSIVKNPFNVFDPTNIISLPLDNKHYLTIFPNTEPAKSNRIFRGDRDKWFGLSTNLEVENNSEDWIFGKPNTIKAHIADQIKYGKYTPENLQAFSDIKEKAIDNQALLKIIEDAGTFADPKVARKVRDMLNKKIHRDDPEMWKFVYQLKEKGISILI